MVCRPQELTGPRVFCKFKWQVYAHAGVWSKVGLGCDFGLNFSKSANLCFSCLHCFSVNVKSLLKGTSADLYSWCIEELTYIPILFGVQSWNEKFWQQG